MDTITISDILTAMPDVTLAEAIAAFPELVLSESDFFALIDAA